MNNSWHLGRFAGIDVRIHWTFLLLPVWIYFSSMAAGSDAIAASMAVLFILVNFGCVVLHENGHALTARRFGIGTRDITLPAKATLLDASGNEIAAIPDQSARPCFARIATTSRNRSALRTS